MSDTDYHAFGHLLRFWRKVRGLSQETLALNLQSSTRHISFLENGKARPGEAFVEAIAETLGLGERDGSYLRLAAGYLARSQKVDFEAPEFKWLRKATLLSLKAMDPYPAVLMDRYGRLLMVNRSWVAFYRESVTCEALAKVENHFEFLFRRPPEGSAQEPWRHMLAMILMYTQQEALLTNDPIYHAMVAELSSYPGIPEDWADIASRLEPMASYRVQQGYKGRLMRFFCVSLNVGAMGPASYVSEPRLTINTLYPEGDELDLGEALNSNLSHPLLFY